MSVKLYYLVPIYKSNLLDNIPIHLYFITIYKRMKLTIVLLVISYYSLDIEIDDWSCYNILKFMSLSSQPLGIVSIFTDL